MITLNREARIAGLLYFALVLIGPIGLVIVPNILLGSDDPAVTAQRIASHEMLFRAGMFADIAGATLEIFVTLALYRLLSRVDRPLAIVMAVLGLMSTPIFFVNTVFDGGALLFAHGAADLSAFTRTQQDAMALFFVHLHHYGTVVNEVFWGLWLLPFGMLVYKSTFLPRILGAWLVLNGFAYLAQNVTGMWWPRYTNLVANAAFPLQFGEVAIVMWLLVMGAKGVQASGGPRPV